VPITSDKNNSKTLKQNITTKSGRKVTAWTKIHAEIMFTCNSPKSWQYKFITFHKKGS